MRYNINPITIEQYLKGVKYPANKDALVEHAITNDALDEVLDILDYIKNKTYKNSQDVLSELRRVEYHASISTFIQSNNGKVTSMVKKFSQSR